MPSPEERPSHNRSDYGRARKTFQPYSMSGKHQSAIDRQNHSALEIRFKEVYGKWPSALELQQAWPFLKLRPMKDDEE